MVDEMEIEWGVDRENQVCINYVCRRVWIALVVVAGSSPENGTECCFASTIASSVLHSTVLQDYIRVKLWLCVFIVDVTLERAGSKNRFASLLHLDLSRARDLRGVNVARVELKSSRILVPFTLQNETTRNNMLLNLLHIHQGPALIRTMWLCLIFVVLIKLTSAGVVPPCVANETLIEIEGDFARDWVSIYNSTDHENYGYGAGDYVTDFVETENGVLHGCLPKADCFMAVISDDADPNNISFKQDGKLVESRFSFPFFLENTTRTFVELGDCVPTCNEVSVPEKDDVAAIKLLSGFTHDISGLGK